MMVSNGAVLVAFRLPFIKSVGMRINSSIYYCSCRSHVG